MAASLTLAEIASLQEKGIDMVRAYTDKGSIMDIVATSKLVAVAEIVSVDMAAGDIDGYNSTITLKLVEALKGRVQSGMIQLREITGKASSGMITSLPGDLVRDLNGKLIAPPAGTQYLLHLSKNIYPLHVLANDGTPLSKAYYIRTGSTYRITEEEKLISIDEHVSGTQVLSNLGSLRVVTERFR